MNRRNLACATLAAFFSTLASGQAFTGAAIPANPEAATSAQLRAAYLECDRVTSTQGVGMDYMNACAEIGSVLLHRDFGGDFRRQIEWWRSARSAASKHDDSLAATELQP